MSISATATLLPATLRADLQAIAEFIPPRAKVLDLGCGDGELLAYLAQHKQVQGRGIELSEAGVLACVRRGLSVRQGNLEEGLADYPDGRFEVVILSQTLPFLNNPERMVGEMLRVGQMAIVSFPNWGYWRCRVELLMTGRLPQAPAFEQQWHDAKRWQFFTAADFADFCRWQGIGVEAQVFLAGNRRIVGRWPNWRARTAVFALRKPSPQTQTP